MEQLRLLQFKHKSKTHTNMKKTVTIITATPTPAEIIAMNVIKSGTELRKIASKLTKSHGLISTLTHRATALEFTADNFFPYATSYELSYTDETLRSGNFQWKLEINIGGDTTVLTQYNQPLTAKQVAEKYAKHFDFVLATRTAKK